MLLSQPKLPQEPNHFNRNRRAAPRRLPRPSEPQLRLTRPQQPSQSPLFPARAACARHAPATSAPSLAAGRACLVPCAAARGAPSARSPPRAGRPGATSPVATREARPSVSACGRRARRRSAQQGTNTLFFAAPAPASPCPAAAGAPRARAHTHTHTSSPLTSTPQSSVRRLAPCRSRGCGCAPSP